MVVAMKTTVKGEPRADQQGWHGRDKGFHSQLPEWGQGYKVLTTEQRRQQTMTTRRVVPCWRNQLDDASASVTVKTYTKNVRSLIQQSTYGRIVDAEPKGDREAEEAQSHHHPLVVVLASTTCLHVFPMFRFVPHSPHVVLHWQATQIDVLVDSVANGLTSSGGFCAGSHIVADHQHINGISVRFLRRGSSRTAGSLRLSGHAVHPEHPPCENVCAIVP